MGNLSDFKKTTKKPTGLSFVKIADEKSVVLQFLAEVKDFEYIAEHSKPSEWYKSSVCTYDQDGGCYACEQRGKDWNAKIKVFIPVLYKGKFSVLSQGMGANSIIHSLMEHTAEHGSILHKEFNISRSGKGKRTKYIAEPLDPSEFVLYNGDISLSELRKSMNFNAQAKYYK